MMAAGVAMTVVGAIQTGVGADEPTHVKRLTMFMQTGLYVVKKEQDAAGPGVIPDTAYVYGPVTTRVAHKINVLAGHEGAGEVARSPEAYLVRHLVVAGLGVVGLLAAAAVGGVLLRSWRWGVVTGGVLAAIPMWTGYAMFNNKDTPVAAGHTLITLGLVVLCGAGWSLTRLRWLLGTGALFLGTVIMLGTRPGMWVSLAMSVVLFLVVLAWTRALAWVKIAGVVAALGLAYAVLWEVYPRIYSTPLVMLWKSATSSADYPHGSDSGRMYQIEQMGQVWPVLLLCFLIVGTIAAARVGLRKTKARNAQAAVLVVVAAQAFALPTLIGLKNSHLYNGLRQTLFAVPAQAVLAAFGMAVLIGAAARMSRPVRGLLATSVIAGLVLPMAVQFRLYPYQYSYVNAAAELAGVDLEPDYFKTSFREYAPLVSDTEKLVCPHRLSKGKVNRNQSDCRTMRGRTFSAYWRFDGRRGWDIPESNEFYALLRGQSGTPPYCTLKHEVTRWQNFERVTMSRLFDCRPPISPDNARPSTPSDPWAATNG